MQQRDRRDRAEARQIRDDARPPVAEPVDEGSTDQAGDDDRDDAGRRG